MFVGSRNARDEKDVSHYSWVSIVFSGIQSFCWKMPGALRLGPMVMRTMFGTHEIFSSITPFLHSSSSYHVQIFLLYSFPRRKECKHPNVIKCVLYKQHLVFGFHFFCLILVKRNMSKVSSSPCECTFTFRIVDCGALISQRVLWKLCANGEGKNRLI